MLRQSRSLVITQCCIHELYLQGKAQQPAVDLAKNFERRKCNHREPIPGDECLESVIGDKNKHRYVVATQSHPLRIKLRLIQATPIVHINRSVIVLEPPSDVTLKAKEAAEAQKLNATTAPDLVLVGPSAPEERKVKRKGPKGPNPLSVKKKKVELEKGKKKPLSKEDSVAAKAGTKRKAEDSEEEHDPEEVQAEETQAGLLTPAAKRRKRKRKKMAASITQTNVESTDANVD
ncbi:hypothetical protein D9613_001957 [Agrocybe pediades]|uniref:UTP23 sensor motif region domain-containing protein n=1 Tax=Agrocybe pediades TaxID=84607 RepID=A0A8H4R818_9AGAR|nr:hypothetical protein D9613_001957 [Agrocybe pediades]